MKKRNTAPVSKPRIPVKAENEIMEVLSKDLRIGTDEIVKILKKHNVSGDTEALQDSYRKRVGQRLIASMRDEKGRRELLSVRRPEGNEYEYPLEAFKERLLKALKDTLAEHEGNAVYRPTPEILRLENEIDRRLGKSADSAVIRKMILDAALLRYLAGPSAEEKTIEPDWAVFKNEVDAALIYAGEIQIRLKQERKWNTDAGIGKECTAHTRQPNAHPHGQAEKRQGAGSGLLPGEYGSG